MNARLTRCLSFLGASSLLVGALGTVGSQEKGSESRRAKANDAVALLQRKIDGKSKRLTFEPGGRGYLRSLLRELGIDSASQVLVFSQTSLQFRFIGPQTPRAIYFGGESYVGWIPGAPFIEIISIDPVQGPQFYTLANKEVASPRLVRQTDDCLSCHSSPSSRDVPRFLARSVYPGPDGRVLTAAGSFVTTSVSPIEDRWGGWYVTGGSGTSGIWGTNPPGVARRIRRWIGHAV